MKPTKSIYILLSLFLIFSCDDNSVEPLVCDESLTDVDGVCTLSNDVGIAGKTVTFTAEKDGVTKNATIFGYDNQPVTSSIADDSYGGFFKFWEILKIKLC